jgi:signal transduction histidine kinase
LFDYYLKAVTQLAQEMVPALTAHGITLQLEPLGQLGLVALHAPTVQRALLNLVQNAIEAMPHGGTLTLRGRRQDATVHLDVGDTGVGIPPEQATQIFEPLHTTKPGGTGLGLYIVQEVVAAHSGQVTVQSVVGETLAHGGHASVDAHQGLGLFTDLRREFPQATIITINLAALLNALDEAVEPEDA